MPYFVGLIWGGFMSVLASSVGRILVALSISYVTYQGFDVLLESMKSHAFSAMGSMGPLVGVVGMLKLGECLNVVVSAVAAKYALQGLTSEGITKMVIRK